MTVCSEILPPGLAAYQQLTDAGKLCDLAEINDLAQTVCQAAAGEARNRALSEVDDEILCAVFCCCSANPSVSETGRNGYQACASETFSRASELLGSESRFKPEVSFNMRANPPEPLMDKDLLGRLTTERLRFPRDIGRMSGRINRDFPGVPPFRGTDTRRPDLVLVRDPDQPPTRSNISRVVDFKFGNDTLSDAQEQTYRRISPTSNVEVIDDDKCDCGGDDDGRKVRQLDLLAQSEAAVEAQRSMMSRLGWGALGVVGIAATAALALFPLDGPAGEIAAGTATAGAWARALGTAGVTATRAQQALVGSRAAFGTIFGRTPALGF